MRPDSPAIEATPALPELARPARSAWLLSVILSIWAFAFLLRWLLDNIAATLHFTVDPFQDSALDGPYQLFNALRRLAAGQTPGVDFQYFHGLGLVYIHYPLFAWFGRDILASEISRDVM